jgi:SpoVK/Ycf46/Vps4 family AAA+-type ATPase
MSKFVSESEELIRMLIKDVRENAPAALLLDKCDGMLCNSTADATQSHKCRLLQKEMKSQCTRETRLL